MDSILYKINMNKIDLYKITLICDEDTLVKRIKKDIKFGIRDEGNIKRSLDKLKLYKNMNTLKIDTANKSIDEIVENIKNIINN